MRRSDHTKPFFSILAIFCIFSGSMLLPHSRADAQSVSELTDIPYHIESIGLTVNLPLGSTVEDNQIGGASKGFRAKAKDNSWLLSFSVRTSRDLSLTANAVAESLIEGLLSRRTQRDARSGRAVGSGTRILNRDRDLQIDNRAADRFYAALSTLDGGEIRTGYTIIHTAPGQFAVFQIDTTTEAFEPAKAITEASIATSRFRDPSVIASERKAGLEAGEAFLAAVTTDDLRAVLLTEPTLYRVYRPAPNGAPGDAEEVAFQFVSMHQGQRGELDPRKSKSRWSAIDQEKGFLVSVHARALNVGSIIESESVFFLREDRQSEAWAIRMIIKEGENEMDWTETGVREGADIKVIVDVPASTPVVKQWRKPAVGYCSQVESYLLPALLVRARAIDPMQFYLYQTSGTDIALRSDQLDLAGDSQPERPRWTLVSKRSEDAEEDTIILDGDGSIIRKDLGTGLVVVPTTREALDRLWRSKGLPPVG
jgi:hypothetical protein